MNMLRIAFKSALSIDPGYRLPRHGAAVVRGGALLAVGHNGRGCHAEIDALEKLSPEDRVGCTVYSVRVARTMTHAGMAKPCPNCEAYMREYGVKKVYYSTPTGEIDMMRLRKAA